MKKFLHLLMGLLFLFNITAAQKTNDDGGSGGNNNTDGDTGDNACMNTALEITGLLFGTYQKKLVSSSQNPSVTSFEFLVHGGMGSGNDQTFMAALPRVRLNYGALSGDIRYSYLNYEGGASDFLDAIVDFNIIAGKSFKMSIGQGIMYLVGETESNMFHESFIGMDLGILNRMIMISPEFRLAYDWNIKEPVNSELTLRAGYRIFGSSSFAIYANLAGAYQSINPDTNNTLFYGGFDIFIQ